MVVALFTLDARQCNENAICFLGHNLLRLPLKDSNDSPREPMVGIELTTSPLPRVCSTTELHGPAPEILSNASSISLALGGGGRIRTCVRLPSDGFTDRCH